MGRFCAITLACSLLVLAQSARAIVFGQVDTFEDGTTMDWANGAPGNLVNVNTGGPGGAGDHYLQLSANGNLGVGGHLTTFNLQQWLGHYIAQGVDAIEVALRNTGTATPNMRLAVKVDNLMNSACL